VGREGEWRGGDVRNGGERGVLTWGGGRGVKERRRKRLMEGEKGGEERREEKEGVG